MPMDEERMKQDQQAWQKEVAVLLVKLPPRVRQSTISLLRNLFPIAA